jgi:predicted Ser/Thr protein kinase
VAAYVVAVLPRLSAGTSAVVTLVVFVVLLGAEYGLLSGGATWVKLVLPGGAAGARPPGLTTKRFLVTEAGKIKSDEESAETNRMMGLALQGQGQLDMAFDRFRRVPMGDAVMGNMYNLALDFERKRQFNKAQAVYEHMATYDKDYKDLQSKLNRAKNMSETVMLGGGGSHPGGTMLLDGGAVEKPMLGRYQVDKELGKGAMGVVYLGKDPKIGRVVAIKTMALSQEFSGDELVDARERFFREAETAGRLQHQNIVTIFDAGEEHDLAYIAMEFLKGKDLLDFCKDGNLLPVPKVLSIVARVAEALAYAHRQNVVHRDIKPANIMYELDSDTVKVTDFGIARITDSSKTKTGLVLGTPSFMSPEQTGRQEGGWPLRPVFAGRDAVPDAHGRVAVPRRVHGRADVQDRQRGSAGHPHHPQGTAREPGESGRVVGQQAARDALPGRRPVCRRPACVMNEITGVCRAHRRSRCRPATGAPTRHAGHEKTAVFATAAWRAAGSRPREDGRVRHGQRFARPVALADAVRQDIDPAVRWTPGSARGRFEKTAVHQIARRGTPAPAAGNSTAPDIEI